MNRGPITLFALHASRDFGQRVSGHLGIPLSDHEERTFEDGEHKARPLVSVRGKDVFVIQSLYSDNQMSVNDKLCRLLFFLGCVRDGSAQHVTAVVPYLCYARKDRQTKPRDPVTTRYVAALFEAVGVERVVTLDVHNPTAFQNAFRCRTDHLEAGKLFADHFAPFIKDHVVSVVSPDAGGVKRADRFRQTLECVLGRSVSSAFMEKQRSEGVVTGHSVVGDVDGKAAMIIDDLISTGTTITRAAGACRRKGAAHVLVAASHGLFVGDASRVLADPNLDRVVVTDSVPPFRLDPDTLKAKVTVLDGTWFFAEAIKRIHEGGSLVQLQETGIAGAS